MAYSKKELDNPKQKRSDSTKVFILASAFMVILYFLYK